MSIAQMRMHTATHPGDAVVRELVSELSDLDPQFARWWAAHDVAVRDAGTKLLHHPVVGELHLSWNAVTWAVDPDLQIIVWTAEPGTVSHDRLRLLAAWVAESTRLRVIDGDRLSRTDTGVAAEQ